MRRLISVLSVVGIAFAAHAAPVTGTSGPYAVVVEKDPTLPTHAIFRPADLAAVKGTMPVLAFGNGGCVNIGTAFQPFLSEVASYGYVVTAPGPIQSEAEMAARRPAGPPRAPGAAGAPPAGGPPPGGPPPGGMSMQQSAPDQMIKAIDWAIAESKRAGSPYNGKIDASRIAVGGQSCGGLEAIKAGGDPRVKTVLILNSGIIRGGIPNPDGTTRAPAGYLPATEADIPNLHTPVAYLIGGEKDQAYRGAEGDYAQITQKIPVFNANTPVGHGGTWREPHGGMMGEAALAWLNWQLKGDAKAGKTFIGKDCGLCKDSHWTVKTKNMN